MVTRFFFFGCMQVLDTPSLLAEGSKGVKKNIFKDKPQSDASASGCCWSYFTRKLHFKNHGLKEKGIVSIFMDF